MPHAFCGGTSIKRRDYPDRPIVGVTGVVFDGDGVVLVRRGRPPAYGEWALPGGAVEVGERLDEAIIREVHEEVGLTVQVVELVAVLDRIFLDKDDQVQYHYILMDFLCRKRGGRLRAGGDALSSSVVPMAALSQYQLSKETKEVIRRAYHRLNGGSPPIYLEQTFRTS